MNSRAYKTLKNYMLIAMMLFLPMSGESASFKIIDDETLVDQAGRQIHLNSPFRRIISLYGAHTENLFALGLSKEIIGVTRHEVYPKAALARPVFSYRDDGEKFLAARPDLVLVRPMIDRGYPALMKRLEKSGITVVSLQPRTVREMYAYWLALGALTGRKTAAQKMVDAFKRRIDGITIRTATITPKKKVYFEAIHKKMRTFSPDAIAISAVTIAGGVNVARLAIPRRGTNIADFGKERILSQGPEIDVYLAQVGTMNQVSIERIKKEPGFSTIKAVKTNHVYLIDEMIVSRPSLRLLEGISRIGQLLYPERFPNGFIE